VLTAPSRCTLLDQQLSNVPEALHDAFLAAAIAQLHDHEVVALMTEVQ
jgi:hypothetical protein